MDVQVWPERTVLLPSSGRMRGDSLLTDLKVRDIIGAATDRMANYLDEPTMLNNDNVRLVALVLLGGDGISGNNMLLCRVTEELTRQTGHVIRLTVFSYESTQQYRPEVLPGRASRILDEMVQRIKDIPGLVPASDPSRFGSEL